MDTTTAVTTGTNFLSNRSDAMVILVLVLVGVILFIWKILIPQKQSEARLRDADKEIHRMNANTLTELSKVTTGIHEKTTQSHKTISAMMEVKEIELTAIGKIAEVTNCDL